MEFQHAVRRAFSKYVTFTGRAMRSEFWWFALFVVLVNAVAEIIDRMIFGFGLLGAIAALVLFLPQLTVAVRRLHDTGRSGWWLLIALIPLIGWIVLLYFYIQPSDHGDNRYGLQPVA
ncbi:DUF805 domain-containing protein [Rhizobium halophytocola]|uniref:Uncharacterized membrane protein YhaH (DUF805 family) n=1 Tax=Rhizobium halophytocola TaxID=735519 RepID=A0ABS4E084_9HYPH|nr:DUF805 domain-containing protein [Rhizobium halophytocola]MBP1851348.1 uncharacterized membrane protein YhaH (DUF805 family) [Rhizobium halophytocola]